MANLCTACGANLDMVGRAHRCVPRSSGVGLGIHQPGSNTLATKAKVKGQSGRARERVKCPADSGHQSQSESNQRQVRSAGKPQRPRKTKVNPGRKVVSRVEAGRTAQDAPRSETAGAVAIPKMGRPRKPAGAPISRATMYRRKAEAEKAKQ